MGEDCRKAGESIISKPKVMVADGHTINSMHVLIFEVNLSGHHSIYLEKVAQAHLELGRVVTIVFSEKYKSSPFLDRFSKQFNESLHVVTLRESECENALKSRWGDVGRELSLWRIFGRIFRSVSITRPVDYVFLPYLDYCLNAIGLLGSPFGKVPWGGICMRPAFHLNACGAIGPQSKLSHIKKHLFFRLLSSPTLKQLFTIDELLAKYIGDSCQKFSEKILFLADPAEPQQIYNAQELRHQFGIPDNVVIILVYGALDERKGLGVLLNALGVGDSFTNVHLLMVGVQSEYVLHLLTSSVGRILKVQNRLHEINSFVDDVTEQKVFAACDIVWVGYREHYTMSGVLVRAGMAAKPVIASNIGLLGWYAQYYHLGVTVELGQLNSVRLAIEKLNYADERTNLGNNCAKVFANNTWAGFIDGLFYESSI